VGTVDSVEIARGFYASSRDEDDEVRWLFEIEEG
jgi:hypothetical protein